MLMDYLWVDYLRD